MIHITAQMRVLVAIEAVFSFSEAAEGRRYAYLRMTGKDTGWRKSVFPTENSGGGRSPVHRLRHWRLMRRSC